MNHYNSCSSWLKKLTLSVSFQRSPTLRWNDIWTRRIFTVVLTSSLVACANKNTMDPPLAPTNRVIEKTVTIPPPELAMVYHLNAGNNPALIKAYQEYQKTGEAKTVETEQFVQFPYDVGSQPIIAASTLELTVISLEDGEQVTSVSSGDPLRWSYSLAYSGDGDTRQAHIMIKPAKANTGTDFFITTDKRAYLLKLVATANGKYTRNVRFWYPQTIQNDWQKYNIEKQADSDQNPVIAELPNVDVSQLNFNYQLELKTSKPVWIPEHVFDDGVHTYIQIPAKVSAGDLPVLFVQNNDQQEMVNYRVKMPYFVVDKVFSKAVLISGVGRQQQRVGIINLGAKED